MVRTVWFGIVAVLAALAMTVGTPVAAGGGVGCPGQYEQLFLTEPDDPRNIHNENFNGYICEYVGKGTTKPPYVDDNNKQPKKQI